MSILAKRRTYFDCPTLLSGALRIFGPGYDKEELQKSGVITPLSATLARANIRKRG